MIDRNGPNSGRRVRVHACTAPLMCVALACVITMVAGCSRPDASIGGVSADAIDYNWHVRPILSENCFKCHGPDSGNRKAGLRLDLREAALGELPETPGKHAIVAGRAEVSVLMQRILAENPDDRMPPASEHKTLSANQVEILRRWINDGAEYKKHWAFIKPEVPAIPDTRFEQRVSNEIDRFVFERLESEGLSPSPEADRETLINRVSLTLTGLPPSLEDVDRFINDPSPDAYEQLVDRLLASPQYAEQMTAYWMDLARWSESDGFLDDHHDRFLWPWRDWVLAAFENNMPFDQFGTEQLAGDLIPNASKDQILATAFLRVGKRTTENGAIDEEYKAEYMVERTDNALGTAFMGLTVGCARCHDHKYDPISQKEYYELGAFFNSNDEPGVYAPGFSGIQGGPTLPWPSDEQTAQLEAAERQVVDRERAYRAAIENATVANTTRATELARNADETATAIRRSLAAGLAAYYTFDEIRPASPQDLAPPRPPRIPPDTLVELNRNPFGAAPPANETPEQRRRREQSELAMRVPRTYNAEQLRLSASSTQGVGAAVIQAPILRDGVKGQALFFDETNKGFLGRDVGWYDRTDPFSIDFWFYAAQAYDNVPVLNHVSEQNAGRTGYRIAVQNGRLWVSFAHSPPANMIALEGVDTFPVGVWTHITLTYDGSSRAAGAKVYVNGKPANMRVDHDSLTRSMLPWNSGDVFDPFVGLAFGTRFREKAPVDSGIDELRVFHRALVPIEVAFLHDDRALNDDLASRAQELNELLVANDQRVVDSLKELSSARDVANDIATAIPQVLVMGDAPRTTPTFVLERGVYSAHGAEVTPQGLAAVMEWDESLPGNRLGLTKWLFDSNNPLTARVFVNRMWQMHFGRGIVETAEDFGSQGSIPTHPELLDWLTVQFASNWDIKALHRLIVLSSTYKQVSVPSDDLLAKDPVNALYARGPRWRMTAEMIRDNALSVSGLLVNRLGGKSVKPYQPDGIWNPLNSFYAYPAADSVPQDEHHRRTLYTFVKRNALHPALKIFDFKNRTESIARRRSSNTPLQALALMNDPQYVEAYRSIATEALKYSTDADERLRRLYRLGTRTTARSQELDLLRDFYSRQISEFAGDTERAAKLLNVGVGAADPSLNAVELAAMTNVAALVMNSPEAYTVR